MTNSVTANAVYCLQSILPNIENWLRKLYDKNYNNDTSNEDKHKTQLQHEQRHAQHAHHLSMHWERAIFCHTLFIWVSSFVIHVHVRFSLSSTFSSSTSTCPSLSSSFPSPSCTSSSTLSSTRSPCKTCAPPRTRGVGHMLLRPILLRPMLLRPNAS